MKILSKVSLLLSVTVLLHASSFEYPMLYKDTRVMGMGGANVAVGGEASSIFSNPAGLSAMDPSEGLELELINFTAGLSGGFLGLVQTATDNQKLLSEDLEAYIDKMSPYRKSNFNLGLNDYSSISIRGEKYAFSMGYLVGGDLNLLPHLSLGSDGLFEVNTKTTTGLIVGFAYDITNAIHVGLGYKSFAGFDKAASLKLVSASSVSAFADNPAAALSDYNTTSIDLGVTYYLDDLLPDFAYLEPTVGISWLNIGGINMGDYYASIPQTINIGISLRPDFSFLSDWTFAMDYIDFFNGYDAAGLDGNFFKRLRLGFSATLIRNAFVELTGSVGAYNVAPTFGIQARLAIFEVNFATYAEEIGAYAGQNQDRRYQLSVVVGF